MRYGLAKTLLCATLAGLCICAQANTTEPQTVIQTAQTDLSFTVPIPSVATTLPARIALLLPLRSTALSQAANAVRAGVMAAHERALDGTSIDVIDTGDTPAEILDSYTEAATQHDIIIGPLSRSGVTALVQGNAVNRPTLALTQPDAAAGESKIPPMLLTIGLSIEEEARQVADWAAANRKASRAIVVSTPAAWQQRAANAFATQWQQKGREAQVIELAAGGGYLEAKGLVELKSLVQAEAPELVFVALDARQARQVRAALGQTIAIYGTSQLNPLSLADWETAARTNELDGARFVDMPWQLQAADPVVTSYPRREPENNDARGADLERLYALGIDAYRIAQQIAANRNSFELDGVSGKLNVRFGQGEPVFSRIGKRAQYQQGVPVVVER